MPHTTAVATTSTEPSPLTPKEPFPLRAVLLAALIPTLLGAACALFIAPPLINHDTAMGFRAWLHFVEGGTWNTILTPDFNNIAQSIESPVTWWAPGQYVHIGILHSLGLSIGTASIIVSAAGILLFGPGLAALAHSMKIPSRHLPWLTAVACSTNYMLYPFGYFTGGEVIQIAIWPWAVFAAWKLRKRTIPLITVLPLIFLIGAFGKHSFAIYALAILVFLWIEALRESKEQGHTPTSWSVLWSASYPIVCIGILFIVGRYFLIDTNHTPGSQGVTNRSFAESLGYSFYGPIFGLSGIGRVVDYISYIFFGEKPEDVWTSFGPTLSLLSPLPFALYTWLAFRQTVVDRIAGVVAITVGLIFFTLLWGGGDISFETRHYQPVAMLLLLTVSSRLSNPNRLIAWGSKIALLGISLFGCATLLQRHIRMASPNTDLDRSVVENVMIDQPQSIQKALQHLAGISDSIIVSFNPVGICVLNSNRHPATQFILKYRSEKFTNIQEKRGRVSQIAFALKTTESDREEATHLRESFKDYSPEEWISHELDGWVIWQAGDVVSLGEAEI